MGWVELEEGGSGEVCLTSVCIAQPLKPNKSRGVHPLAALDSHYSSGIFEVYKLDLALSLMM